MKYLLLLTLLFLASCSDGYRYPCQDPDNWEKKECKKPYCSANGTCPEDLTNYEKKNLTINKEGNAVYVPSPAQQTTKGDCK